MIESAPSFVACPPLPDLVLAADGELPEDQLRTIRTHLRTCASCRQSAADLRLAVSAFRVPLVDVDAAVARHRTFRERLRAEQKVYTARTHTFALRRWLPIAAALILCVLSFLFSDRLSPTLKADELLSRAVAQEQITASIPIRRVQVQLTGFGSRRSQGAALFGSARTDVNSASSVVQQGSQINAAGDYSMLKETGVAAVSTSAFAEETERELAQVFAQHRFDWENPLSAANFSRWRASLLPGTRTDTVVTDDPRLITLRTRTSEGALVEAELVLRANDYRAVAQSWLFADRRRVVITEVHEVARHEVVPPPLAASPVTPLSSVPVSGERLERTELRARRLLHDSRADLDPDVAITRSAGHIELHGVVVSRETYAHLSKQLSELPDLRAALDIKPETDGERATNATSETGDIAVGSTRVDTMSGRDESGNTLPSAAMERWLKKRFGAREAGDIFVPDTVGALQELGARARAWDELAQRYPPEVVSGLPKTARSELASLVDVHYADLAATMNVVDRRLALLLGTTTRAALAVHAPVNWQSRADGLARESSRLLRLFRKLVVEDNDDLALPANSSDGTHSLGLTELSQVFDRLWAAFPTQSAEQAVSEAR